MIQYAVGNEWLYADPSWDFRSNNYRVKPEPVVRRVDAHQDFANYVGEPNLELEFIDGKLVGAKVL